MCCDLSVHTSLTGRILADCGALDSTLKFTSDIFGIPDWPSKQFRPVTCRSWQWQFELQQKISWSKCESFASLHSRINCSCDQFNSEVTDSLSLLYYCLQVDVVDQLKLEFVATNFGMTDGFCLNQLLIVEIKNLKTFRLRPANFSRPQISAKVTQLDWHLSLLYWIITEKVKSPQSALFMNSLIHKSYFHSNLKGQIILIRILQLLLSNRKCLWVKWFVTPKRAEIHQFVLLPQLIWEW